MEERTERSYLMVKPDGVQRGLVGKIISRFEEKGFQLVGLKMLMAPEDVLDQHYGELKDRPFYPGLLEYIKSGPVVAMAWQVSAHLLQFRNLYLYLDIRILAHDKS